MQTHAEWQTYVIGRQSSECYNQLAEVVYKILIVEDDAGIARTFAQQLEKWDMEPRVARRFSQSDGGVF